MKGKNWTKPQRFIIAISGILIAISGYLTFTQGTLFGLAAPTISILSIFLSSLLLWLFVATDWPSVLCYILLGIGILPGVSYGQIFNLSFGNTTFVFLLFTFHLFEDLSQRPWEVLLLGKHLGILSELSIQVSYLLVFLFRRRFSL